MFVSTEFNAAKFENKSQAILTDEYSKMHVRQLETIMNLDRCVKPILFLNTFILSATVDSCNCRTTGWLEDMRHQYIKSILVILLILTLSKEYVLLAGEHYDPEGHKIVEVLRREFPVPLDNAERPPVPGVYWQPWSYWIFFGMEHSSGSLWGAYGVRHDYVVIDILP
jgi:hypothetical protein